MIIAGDIGGTKIHLARFTRAGASLVKGEERLLPTAGTPSLPEAIAAFAEDTGGGVEACGLGVAGPVAGGFARGTNLPWDIDAAEVAVGLGSATVFLRNDIVASAYALDDVAPADLVTLQEGTPADGANRALISPGTGLGESVLLRVGGAWHPVASEGGHADFAPRTDEELELLRWLRDRFERVSVERVVSGPGLVNVFCFLRDTTRVPDDSGVDASPGDSAPAALIARAGLAGGSRITAESLRVWTAALGSAAGNLVLRGTAFAGVWLGGGIPARVLPALREPGFLEAFRAKEPHRELLTRVPVRVVLDPEMALKGAARVAADSLEA